MKLFRYRRPSLKTVLGITKAKKRVKKELGITAALKPFRFWTNAKRRFKRKIGYESEAGRLIRNDERLHQESFHDPRSNYHETVC